MVMLKNPRSFSELLKLKPVNPMQMQRETNPENTIAMWFESVNFENSIYYKYSMDLYAFTENLNV